MAPKFTLEEKYRQIPALRTAQIYSLDVKKGNASLKTVHKKWPLMGLAVEFHTSYGESLRQGKWWWMFQEWINKMGGEQPAHRHAVLRQRVANKPPGSVILTVDSEGKVHALSD